MPARRKTRIAAHAPAAYYPIELAKECAICYGQLRPGDYRAMFFPPHHIPRGALIRIAGAYYGICQDCKALPDAENQAEQKLLERYVPTPPIYPQ